MKNLILLASFLAIFSSCKKEDKKIDKVSDYKAFTSLNDFTTALESLAAAEDDTRLLAFWDSLVKNKQVPFIFNDSVAFLYMGTKDTKSVNWAGDFNGWSPVTIGRKLDSSNLWMVEQSFPLDARLDYKVVVDGVWKLDVLNPHIQYSGMGPNSELRMPEWVFPVETILGTGVTRGTLSPNILITSLQANPGYKVNYKVYLPVNYENLSNLPVIYVTDGHEYADDRLGAMITVLDNLIFQQKIQPVIAVFIDPRDPVTQNNRRMTEYAANIKFANLVADELVAQVDATYKTSTSPTKRAIIGTSMGGWNAGYFGLKRSDKFNLIAIHSPAFDNSIIESYKQSVMLPLKIFMSTGVIHDTQVRARLMKQVFESKGYPLNYIEVNQGHSWGNWRELLEEPLVYFFGTIA